MNHTWWIFALLSAFFAALTAIFAKIGVENIDSNLATAIRTVVILVIAWGIVWANGQFQALFSLSSKTLLFLVLSGVATGLSWLCYFKALQMAPASWVAPVDKLGLALVLLLSAVFLGEALTFKTIVGTVLMLLGTFVLIYQGIAEPTSATVEADVGTETVIEPENLTESIETSNGIAPSITEATNLASDSKTELE
jgi:bacterial/archaeal transporter family protein